MINDSNYLEHLRKGNQKALEYIVDKYSNLIFKVAYSVLNRREVSKECVNDVLLKIWDNIDNFNGEDGQFKKWVCTIAKYTAIDRLRKEIRHSNNIEMEENSVGYSEMEENLELKDHLNRVMDVISGFKDQDREIFNRRFILGQSLKEVSEGLNLTEKYVGQRISRCRDRLKKTIGPEVLMLLSLLSLETFNSFL